MAQGDRGAGAQRLLRAPAEPPRLPYSPDHCWQADLWKALAEGVTSLTDFLARGWQRGEVPLDAHHVTAVPTYFVGSVRTALYAEQVCGSVAAHQEDQTLQVCSGQAAEQLRCLQGNC